MNQILTCSLHNQQAFFILFQNNSDKTILKCTVCVVQDKLQGEDLILISDIFSSQNQSQDRLCALNFEESFAKRILNIKKKLTEGTFQSQREAIKKFFSSFLEEISSKIKQKEKEQLRQVDKLFDQFVQFQKETNLSTLQYNLSVILTSSSSSANQIENQIRKFFVSIKEDHRKNQRLDNTLKELEKNEFFFAEEEFDSIKDCTFEDLEGIIPLVKLDEEQLQMSENQNFIVNENEIKLQFQKSKVKKSSQAILSYKEDKFLSIYNPKRGRIIAYTNFILDKNAKYLIQVSVFNNASNGYQLIGLVPEHLKDSQEMIKSNLTFCSQAQQGLMKKIKGECFSKTLKKVQQFKIQIRICLSKQQFIVCDFPDKNSIYALQEYKIANDQQYRLGVELDDPEDKIIFDSFKIVNNFPDL